MKVSELAKVYTSSTSQVAAKQRWSQGGFIPPRESGVSALAELLQHADVPLSKRDAANDAVDVTPSRES